MKKIFMIVVILFMLYFGIQIGYSFFGSGHQAEYSVKTEEKNFLVKETFSNKKNDIKSYYFEINYDNDIFYYQTTADFKKSNEIIKNIYYYGDNMYSCIFPIFEDNKIISDVICKNNDILYNYHNISGKDKDLDNFILNLQEKGYNASNFVDNSNTIDKDLLKIYEGNVLKETYYGLANYKGVYLINYATGGKLKEVDLFTKDVYKRPLSIFFKKYYVVADYNKDYRFDTFYVVDITNSKVKELKIGKEVSFDGYIQGTENNSIYFFDKTYKTQYEINIKTGKIIEVGNEKTGIKMLTDGSWDRIPAINAVNQTLVFNNKNSETSTYAQQDKVGMDSGYYYLYKKNINGFEAYRTNIQNDTQKMYLFNTDDINRIVYNKEYVYYIKNGCINYYSDNIGNRNLVCYNELNYNDSLIFGVYNNY